MERDGGRFLAEMGRPGEEFGLADALASLFLPPIAAPGSRDVKLSADLCEADVGDPEAGGDGVGGFLPDHIIELLSG